MYLLSMGKYNKILNSFSIKDTLNPKVWDNPEDPKKSKMKTKVKKSLLDIGEKFIEYLGDDSFVEDIVLTGSLSNFNWSEFSDFDLHIIINIGEYEDKSELYKELFNLKKQIFNDKHEIKIFGYDVELYPQDSEEVHTSSGVYSVMNDEWINVPVKSKKSIDNDVLKNKISMWIEKIEDSVDDAISDNNSEKLEKLKSKLREYRKSGLEKDGEFSYENLVFKFLRRSGHIQKMFDASNRSLDKELSVERKIED
jgi:predicted nucleotidyltransferase